MAWVVVVGLMGHGVGLMFCGVACSISEKRDEEEERERDRDDDE